MWFDRGVDGHLSLSTCFSLSLDFNTLTNLCKTVSHKVVEGGGIVRSIRNHGIRDLPHRFRAKYPDTQGNRYYRKGRFISIYYDASPQTMRQVESVISMNEVVLRQTHLKARSKLDYVNIENEDKNPYIRKVMQEELETGLGNAGGEEMRMEMEQDDTLQDGSLQEGRVEQVQEEKST